MARKFGRVDVRQRASRPRCFLPSRRRPFLAPAVRMQSSWPPTLLPKAEERTSEDRRPHIKAAARDANVVSTVCSGRRFCRFAGCQQLAEWAPVNGMPLCGRRLQDQSSWRPNHKEEPHVLNGEGRHLRRSGREDVEGQRE
jgi:hypothetical protein